MFRVGVWDSRAKVSDGSKVRQKKQSLWRDYGDESLRNERDQDGKIALKAFSDGRRCGGV